LRQSPDQFQKRLCRAQQFWIRRGIDRFHFLNQGLLPSRRFRFDL
jgi:hypothetical protein